MTTIANAMLHHYNDLDARARAEAEQETAPTELGKIVERLATIEKRQWEDAETFGEHARRLDALAQRLDALEMRVNGMALRTELHADLPGANQMEEVYDAEHDATFISYWDMKLLNMIRTVNDRLGVAVGGA